jgi:lipid-A-disaccharide synthase
VSLELLSYEKPSVILYHISRTAFLLQRFFRKVKYITLVNLLAARDPFPKTVQSYDPASPDADEVPFPEYLTCEDRSAQLADHVIGWLTDPARRDRCRDRLRQLKRAFAASGASRNAAAQILDQLSGSVRQESSRRHRRAVRRAG